MCTFAEHGGDPRFLQKLEEIAELHSRKQYDYGKDEDPFANLRASQEFGVPPWVGAVIRLNEKVTRIKSFVAKGELKNESLPDSLIDLSIYALIALILFEEDEIIDPPNPVEEGPDYRADGECGQKCGRPAIARTEPTNLTFCDDCWSAFSAGQILPKERVVRIDR